MQFLSQLNVYENKRLQPTTTPPLSLKIRLRFYIFDIKNHIYSYFFIKTLKIILRDCIEIRISDMIIQYIHTLQHIYILYKSSVYASVVRVG